MIDFWYEIWETVRRKPTRVILTGLGISWGIFILILLVGIGEGFEKGVLKLFDGYSKSTTYVFTSQTSKAYKGTAVGQPVTITEEDMIRLRQDVPEITRISPEISHWGAVYSEKAQGAFDVRAVRPDYFDIRILETEKGRLLNSLDMSESRKCVVIGKNVADVLFYHDQPIGKEVRIGTEVYVVVGIIKNTLLSSSEDRVIYMPYSTYLRTNATAKEFTTMVYAVCDGVESKEVNDQVKSVLSRIKNVDPDDGSAFFFNSMEEQVKAFNSLFNTLKGFLWFMGISTLVSGIIGIGNIMYISAKERTREIGIRKSLGARSSSIKGMFLCESIAITSISGYVGIALGWLCLELVSMLMDDDTLMMDKPQINLLITICAMLILMIAGVLAGLKPAMYAADLRPIEALRDEN
jgi:putative ABC transport system permease protein